MNGLKIKKITLYKFKPFLLNDFTYIEYTPHSPYQLITGVNGGGKTSLLKELSPLPPDSNLFSKGGHKEIHLEYNNSVFILKNDYSKSKAGYHSFIKDDVELNSSNNVTEQKQLVQEYFNYDYEIHQLLTDEVDFTSMSGTKRRDWFVRLANCNMEFALNVFNKLKSRARDTLGGIRTTSQTLVSKNCELPTPEVVSSWLNKKEEYLKIINGLEDVIPRQIENTKELYFKLESIYSKLYPLLKDEMNGKVQIPSFPNGTSLEKIEDLRSSSFTYSTLIWEEVEKLKKEYVELDSKLDKSNFQQEMTDSEFEQLFSEIENKYVSNEQYLLSDYYKYDDIHLKFERIYPKLREWFINSPDNSETRYVRKDYELVRSQIEEVNQTLFGLRNRIHNVDEQISHIESCPHTECPKCRYTFRIGVNEDRHSKLIELRKTTLEEIDKKEKELLPLQEKLSSIERVRNNVLYFREEIVDKNPIFQPLWSKLLSDPKFLLNPSVYLNEIVDFHNSLIKHDEVKILEKQHQDILSAKMKRLESKGNVELMGSLKILQQQIESKVQLSKEAKQTVDKYDVILNDYDKLHKRFQVIDDLNTKFQYNLKLYYEAIFNESLKKQKDTLLVELGQINSELNNLDMQQNVIKQLEDSLVSLKRREEQYKQLIDVLNPQDGLIAKSLSGFITYFIDELNHIISLVWTYQMSISTKDNKDFVEDYRFPLDVASRLPVVDISKGSKGQREFINFVFKLLVMKQLNIIGYPLLLDELGNSFNESHRLRTFDYIKQLVETSQIGQVFLISHNASSHDVFNLADRLHLDPDIHLYKGDVNKFVVLK